MRIQMKVEGNKAVVKAIEKATKDAMQYTEEEIHDTTQYIASKAVSRAPVDFRFLSNSNYVKLDRMYGETGFTVKYAPYVEFGTGGLVNVPQGLEDYAIQFKGAGVKEVYLPARPFLFNSAFEETKDLTERLKKAFNGAK